MGSSVQWLRSVSLRVRDFLVDRRVRLSVALCFGAVFIGLYRGPRPLRAKDWQEPSGVGGLLLILCGLSLRSWAAGVLRKGKALTTGGPYRFFRHPLYLGTFLLLVGFALLLPSFATTLPILGAMLLIFWLTARREEQRLAVKYGSAWEEYKLRVGRLVAGRVGGPGEPWALAQWRRSREYNAVLATGALLVAFLLLPHLLAHRFLP